MPRGCRDVKGGCRNANDAGGGVGCLGCQRDVGCQGWMSECQGGYRDAEGVDVGMSRGNVKEMLDCVKSTILTFCHPKRSEDLYFKPIEIFR